MEIENNQVQKANAKNKNRLSNLIGSLLNKNKDRDRDKIQILYYKENYTCDEHENKVLLSANVKYFKYKKRILSQLREKEEAYIERKGKKIVVTFINKFGKVKNITPKDKQWDLVKYVLKNNELIQELEEKFYEEEIVLLKEKTSTPIIEKNENNNSKTILFCLLLLLILWWLYSNYF